MKRGVVILPGIAGVPLDELDGRTALETANTPALDAIAKAGKVGLARLAPAQFDPRDEAPAGAGAALATILGSPWPEPAEPPKPSLLKRLVAPAPAPLALPVPTDGQVFAHFLGVPLEPSDIAWRVDLIAASSDADAPIVQSHRPEQLSYAEATSLLDAWQGALRASDDAALQRFECRALPTPNDCPDPPSTHLVIQRDPVPTETPTRCTEAEELNGRPWHAHPPDGPRSEVLISAMELAQRVFESHPVNRPRADLGPPTVSVAWISGHDQPAPPTPPSPLSERMGLRAVIATTDGTAAAVAKLHGLPLLPLPTRDRTRFAADRLVMLATASVDARDHHDLIVVHDSAALAPALDGDTHGLIGAIEAIDQKLLAPVHKALVALGETDGEPNHRVLVTTDRLVDAHERAPIPGPVPLAVSGAFVRTLVARVGTEREALESELLIEDGPDLLEYALHAGVSRARSNVKGVSQRRAPLDN